MIKAIATYSLEEVSLPLTVIGKLGDAYPDIKEQSKQALIEFISEQKQSVTDAFSKFELETEAINKLVESSKKMSSSLGAVRLNSYIPIDELKAWHQNILNDTFDLLTDEALAEITPA